MASGNKALKDLVEEGKESGFLSLEDLNRSIAASDMSAEDIDGVMGTLDGFGHSGSGPKEIQVRLRRR